MSIQNKVIAAALCMITISVLADGTEPTDAKAPPARDYFSNTYTDDVEVHSARNNVKHPQVNDAKVQTPRNSRGSFYVGFRRDFSYLYSEQRVKSQRFRVNPPSPDSIATSHSNGFGADQAFLQLFVGYETPFWNRLNLGLEAGGGYSPANNDGGANVNNATFPTFSFNTLTISQTDFKTQWTWGVALMPGFQIQPNVTLFGRVGYIDNEFVHGVTNSPSGPSLTGSGAVLNTYAVQNKKWLSGIEAGLGLKVHVSDHVSIRQGYYWSGFEKLHTDFTTGPDTTVNLRTVLRNYTNSPDIESFDVSLIYEFTPSSEFQKGGAVSCGHELYFGAFGSRDLVKASVNTGLSNWYIAPLNPLVDRQDSYGGSTILLRGWGGQGFAGYRYNFVSGPYLGTELFYHPTSAKASSSSSSATLTAIQASNTSSQSWTETKLTNLYGIDFVAGYNFTDLVSLYYKLGFSGGRFNFREKALSNVPLYDLVDTRDDKKDVYGYRTGLGISVSLCHNLYLRNEFMVTKFNSFELPRKEAEGVPIPGDPPEGISTDRHYDIFHTEYSVGLEYRFQL